MNRNQMLPSSWLINVLSASLFGILFAASAIYRNECIQYLAKHKDQVKEEENASGKENIWNQVDNPNIFSSINHSTKYR